MQLKNWGLTFSAYDPYIAPECLPKSLRGEVYGHPRFKDGDNITTASIRGVRNGLIITDSGSEYELGEPHPEYEALYPGAKQYVINQLTQLEQKDTEKK